MKMLFLAKTNVFESIHSNQFGYKKKELITCEEYAKDWKIEFNASKSASMLFEKKSTGLKTDFKLNGSTIPKAYLLEIRNQ
ncbi:hypothetical protein BpHYR1_051675 [Brachionus plicatilis]|uniref:RNA-directed DNA polymerase from mobile element jockey-like n=1 Tax=Brachionus plicatilis TaxID=10195 RepID=A0A3M7Q4X7_BRAPC|nr:hypothetical protein BpHYR1_051675 [Brachionus plicatilis]